MNKFLILLSLIFSFNCNIFAASKDAVDKNSKQAAANEPNEAEKNYGYVFLKFECTNKEKDELNTILLDNYNFAISPIRIDPLSNGMSMGNLSNQIRKTNCIYLLPILDDHIKNSPQFLKKISLCYGTEYWIFNISPNKLYTIRLSNEENLKKYKSYPIALYTHSSGGKIIPNAKPLFHVEEQDLDTNQSPKIIYTVTYR